MQMWMWARRPGQPAEAMGRTQGVPWAWLRRGGLGLLMVLSGWLGWAGLAHAWGEQGHRLIADMAQDRLSPAAQQRLKGLLALEGHGALADISVWADQHRNPTTAPWHYVNFPRASCQYQAERDCDQGSCVVAAIDRQSRAFAQATDPQAQLLALKYLVHLLADVHQPLHAGYQDDRGGNSYQLQAFMLGSNLHALWDTLMIRQLNEDTTWRSRLLARERSGTEGERWSATSVAEESCRLVGSPGFYPQRRVGLDYLQQFAPMLEQRLVLAAERTADLLNRLLAGAGPSAENR